MLRSFKLLHRNNSLTRTIKAIRSYDLINFELNYRTVKKEDLEDLKSTISIKKIANKDLVERTFHKNLVAGTIPFIGTVQFITVRDILDIFPEEGILYPLLNMSLELTSVMGFFVAITYPGLYYLESETKDIIKINKEILEIFENKLK